MTRRDFIHAIDAATPLSKDESSRGFGVEVRRLQPVALCERVALCPPIASQGTRSSTSSFSLIPLSASSPSTPAVPPASHALQQQEKQRYSRLYDRCTDQVSALSRLPVVTVVGATSSKSLDIHRRASRHSSNTCVPQTSHMVHRMPVSSRLDGGGGAASYTDGSRRSNSNLHHMSNHTSSATTTVYPARRVEGPGRGRPRAVNYHELMLQHQRSTAPAKPTEYVQQQQQHNSLNRKTHTEAHNYTQYSDTSQSHAGSDCCLPEASRCDASYPPCNTAAVHTAREQHAHSSLHSCHAPSSCQTGSASAAMLSLPMTGAHSTPPAALQTPLLASSFTMPSPHGDQMNDYHRSSTHAASHALRIDSHSRISATAGGAGTNKADESIAFMEGPLPGEVRHVISHSCGTGSSADEAERQARRLISTGRRMRVYREELTAASDEVNDMEQLVQRHVLVCSALRTEMRDIDAKIHELMSERQLSEAQLQQAEGETERHLGKLKEARERVGVLRNTVDRITRETHINRVMLHQLVPSLEMDKYV